MKIKLVVVLASVMALQAVGARDFRELTDQDGKKIRAELLDLDGGKVKIRTSGRVFEVPLVKLSQEDQSWLAEWNSKRKGADGLSYYSELVFEDDFSGEGFGERWKHYKSASVVKDGVFQGITSPDSDHQAVDTIDFEGRRDVEVAVKFKFSGSEAKQFNLKFDDHDYKGSHAGHICRTIISPKSVMISDDKTGNFENSIYEMKKSPAGLDEETKRLLETKTAKFPIELEEDAWHDLVLGTKGETMTVSIDGEKVGELTSSGIAHATKSSVGMATPGKGISYDDFVVKAAPNSGIEEDTKVKEGK